MATEPTIILIPGSFAIPALYYNVTKPLAAQGYDIYTLNLQTTEKKPGKLPTLADDATYIAKNVEILADQGKDVVLVGHSYGGVPITEAAKGLSKKHRESKGKKGGIVRLAYMTAVVPKLGYSCAEHNGDDVALDYDGWLDFTDLALAASYVFSDLPPEEGHRMMQLFPQHSGPSFADKLTYEGYKDVPCSYLFCEEDKVITPVVQQRGIDAIEAASGKKVDVWRLSCDHCPTKSVPEKSIEWFKHLVELGGKEA
ncbi:alpha/beta-hydrolase [Lojkania enalia]|uniref:Alpha/beta-hydrolase n=1 Tax=Lojkania enalia TaxID=147567 RepID=A0A9P4K4R2_9PLEO|nr:alpha/beta-hydrolase [Didymosphaeria enalia]